MLQVTPHRRKTADVVLQLEKEEFSKWSPSCLGNFFTHGDMAGSSSMLVGAWRMLMSSGEMQPSYPPRPMEFIFREKTVLEPGQIKALTVGL